MHDAFGMCRVERLRDLNGDPHGLGDGQRSSAQPRRQRFAVQVLHHEEVDAIVMADIVKRTDVWMREPCDGTRLVRQPGATAYVGCRVRRQDLQRDVAVEPRIAGSIDFAHTASTGEALNFKHADSRSRRQNPGDG